jgi:hypothetical protein
LVSQELALSALRFKNAFYCGLIFFLGFTLTACQSNREAENITLRNLFGLPTMTATITLTPSPTATITKTATITVTSTSAYTPTPEPTSTPLPPPFFDQFVASLINGNANQVVGVYVDEVLALKVVQQPSSNPAYVSTRQDVATYFTMVLQLTGNTGLLAHNYLAGIYYYDLKPGQSVILIYGDGQTDEYIVGESDEYQALSPNSPTSNFIDVSSGETLTSTDLFYRVYGGSSRTTFQTCIAQDGESSWGRLFVIAPLE